MAIVLQTSIEATGKTGCMTDEDCTPGKSCNPRKICVRRRGAAIKRQFGCMEDSECDEGLFRSDLKICLNGERTERSNPSQKL